MSRPSLVRLAASTSKKPLATSAFSSPPSADVKQVSDQLLPPLPLYRRLLRVHRKVLPIEMRVLGDDYVKAEFRRTRSADNPLHVVGFLGEWKKYLDFHEAQLKSPSEAAEARKQGQKLQEDLLEKLSAEQLGQLFELMQATKEVYTDADTLERDRETAKQAVSRSSK